MSEAHTEDVGAEPTDENSTASSAEHETEDLTQEQGQETEVKEEDPNVILTRNTQKRFNELTEKNRNLEAKISQLEKTKPINYQDPGAPKIEDFDDDIDFARADATYQATKAVISTLNQDRQAQEQQQVVANTQHQLDTYTQRVASFKTDTPDFESVINGSRLQTQDAMGNLTPATEAILQADNGPKVAYHLASNPDVAMQLNGMNPIQAAMAVAHLSTELSVGPAPKNELHDPIGSEDTGAGLAATDDGLTHIGKATFE